MYYLSKTKLFYFLFTKKLCFAASTGGHFEQLMMLKPLMKKYDSFVITEKTKYDVNVEGIRTYYLKQVNRKGGIK